MSRAIVTNVAKNLRSTGIVFARCGFIVVANCFFGGAGRGQCVMIVQKSRPVWDVCRALNGVLRGSGYEVAPDKGGIYRIFRRVSDRRYLRGYHLESVAIFSTEAAGLEFINLNIL